MCVRERDFKNKVSRSGKKRDPKKKVRKRESIRVTF